MRAKFCDFDVCDVALGCCCMLVSSVGGVQEGMAAGDGHTTIPRLQPYSILTGAIGFFLREAALDNASLLIFETLSPAGCSSRAGCVSAVHFRMLQLSSRGAR